MNRLSTSALLSGRQEATSIDKDPWLAVNLSMFFPGLGQWYGGKRIQGSIWALAQLSLIIFTLWSIFSPRGQIIAGLWSLLAIIVLYIVNIFHAHRAVYLARGDRNLEKIPRKRKNPWFAVFASRVLPGLGHLYGDRVIVGMIFLAVSMISLRLDDFFASLIFLTPAIGSIATYHAYHSFPREFHPHRNTYRSLLALMVAVTFGFGTLCNYFPDWLSRNLELFEIPSESMFPTLKIGDRVFVSESSGYYPQRGDIVVFHTPEKLKKLAPDAGEFFIKRVIALGGERVSLRQGKIYLNDRPLEKDYTPMPGQADFPPVVVPPGYLFVLGDNRSQSFDSRSWGFLPEDHLVGRAFKIYWPLDRVRSLLE
ncbi:signal peptidase I [Pannus brasiliensis CCIBt3594]|uniref:Signal peptidase I n=1 Tax=Pannus brasiliensis CCIBt3594 TaxID=1427578 RepID=A0AAW9QND8_9CHRO